MPSACRGFDRGRDTRSLVRRPDGSARDRRQADSARRWLADRADRVQGLRGTHKKVHSRRILAAARSVYESLRVARAALGPGASTDELSAAAGALRVGVTTAELANLARGRREKQLTVPLVVLADLVTRGVPRDTASQTIFQLWQRGAGDDDFYGLWRAWKRT